MKSEHPSPRPAGDPQSAPSTPADQRTREVAGQTTGAGCLLFLAGGVLAAFSTINWPKDGDEPAPTWLITLAGIGIVGGLAVMILGGVWANRRARAGLRELELGRDIPPDLEMIRRIESNRLPATARWEKFPTGLALCREIPNGATPIRIAVNIPALTPKRKHEPVEIGASYLWIAIPVVLPRIAIGPEMSGVPSQITGPDLDIESGEFNRRFRVYAGPGNSPRQRSEFMRYAHAMVHPRAAQCLLKLPVGVTAIIDGDMACAIDVVATGRERIEVIAEVLTEFVALVPDHVLRRWGGQGGYQPRN